ncbi:MAG: DUF6445 family protein [Bacillota bacterium]
MRPELRRFGETQSPVVVIDEFSGDAEAVARIADAMSPFPAVDVNYYPGVRRFITRDDGDADAYVERTCRDAAQFIAGAFDVEKFKLVEASFSIVSLPPGRLRTVQRAPHFDSPDPNYLALLHYLRVPPGSGTAFYRQRSTGIEQVTAKNIATFVRTAEAIEPLLPKDSGYIHASNQYYEQIGAVEAVPDRLIIYQGSLLHSGIIPPGMRFSADPKLGRLTANLFVQGHRGD